MVRTRFAPSPTGMLHVGNVRTALFAYLYAKHMKGNFVLRIEDTDLERSNPEFTTDLMNDLKWLGLEWDEGPGKGGPAGNYLQSERLGIYREYSDRLLGEGRAFHCYCTPEEIESRKEAQAAKGLPPVYDGHCRKLTGKQALDYQSEGRKPVVRFIAYGEDFTFQDIVKGQVVFPKGMVGDFVIMRASGVPVYNYAVVVDDALMKITHVLRADEHLSNTLRQLMIYRALKFETPAFAHMALVLGHDRQKLSKRHGATSVGEFRKLGYPPEALVNYLALLGWSSPDGKELLSREELTALFDLGRLSPSPAVFDQAKLDWIAKHYIINCDIDRVFEDSLPFIKETGLIDGEYIKRAGNMDFLKGVVGLTRGYCSHLSEIKDHIGYFLTDDFIITEDALGILKKEGSARVIEAFIEKISAENRSISEEVFTEIASAIISRTGIKGRNLFLPLRAALTGRTQGPETYFIMPVIGKERTLKRLSKALSISREGAGIQK
jgi:glutamyl-tRNA synthetase